MFELINVNLEKKMDDALHFTAKKLSETGHNSKPVLLHSFKIAMTLYSYNYSETIVIAGILHDLIEDTDIKSKDIEEKFGQKISEIVEVVSFDSKINNKLEQAKIMFENCCNYGYEALIIKCADLLDNINFVTLVDDLEKRKKLLEKYKLFLEMSKEIIGEEVIYRLLKNKYDKIIIDYKDI